MEITEDYAAVPARLRLADQALAITPQASGSSRCPAAVTTERLRHSAMRKARAARGATLRSYIMSRDATEANGYAARDTLDMVGGPNWKCLWESKGAALLA